MTLQEAANELLEKGGGFYAIRDAHKEHAAVPSWRLKALLLPSIEISLEDATGDGYRFTMTDIEAEDWSIYEEEKERRAA